MVSRSVERIVSDLSERVDNVQDWLQKFSKTIPDAKDLRGYLPYQKPKRSVRLPIMLALGGLALVGGLTLLSGVSQKTISSRPSRTPRRSTEGAVSDHRIEVDDLKPMT